MKKILNHSALFIGLILISYPYLAHKIPSLPQFTFKLLLRSTDAAAWQVVVGWVRRRSPWLQNGIFYRWWDNLSLTLNIQGWLYHQKRSPDR